jgi:hypothetical protein
MIPAENNCNCKHGGKVLLIATALPMDKILKMTEIDRSTITSRVSNVFAKTWKGILLSYFSRFFHHHLISTKMCLVLNA